MATPEGKETAAAALAPTSLSLRGDAAVAATRNWEDVCQATPSLATAGVDATRGGFGLDRPGTLRVGWWAQPLLVGRWAWSSARNTVGQANRGAHAAEYAPGDALGDLVLAAGQRVGAAGSSCWAMAPAWVTGSSRRRIASPWVCSARWRPAAAAPRTIGGKRSDCSRRPG